MIRLSIILLVGVLAAAHSHADEAIRPIVEAIEKEIKDGHMVGAQLAFGDRNGIILSRCFGTRGPDDKTAVDGDTRFCIGSCSKPLAAACLLKLAADKKLTLDDPIDKWIPAFKSPRLADGGAAVRAPTLRELLAHRGGVYSQKEKLIARQSQLIRDWRLTLEKSVAGIAAERLIAVPGAKFAYSGAGYCVAGRVAEIAVGVEFDMILRDSLCKSLGLKRTGYFVNKGETNVAIGGMRQDGLVAPHRMSPHLLGAEHRLALVGGSIYSTAAEIASFTRMVLAAGRIGDKVVMPPDAAKEFTKPQFKNQRYGLGWFLDSTPDGEVTALLHNGALAAYRAVILVDLKHGLYLVVLAAVVSGDEEVDGFPRTIEQLGRKTLAEFATKPKR